MDCLDNLHRRANDLKLIASSPRVCLPLAGFICQVQHVDVLPASITLHDHPLLLACLDGVVTPSCS
jgi:hypothetical protein